MGVSVISHPKNPYMPQAIMNIRLFCILEKMERSKTGGQAEAMI